MKQHSNKSIMPNPRPIHRFKKGESGNPKGRPKGALSFTTKVRAALMTVATTKDGKKISLEKALIDKIMQKAIQEGNEQMIRLMWNYLDGMPAQSVDHTTGGVPIINISPEVAKRYDIEDTNKE